MDIVPKITSQFHDGEVFMLTKQMDEAHVMQDANSIGEKGIRGPAYIVGIRGK